MSVYQRIGMKRFLLLCLVCVLCLVYTCSSPVKVGQTGPAFNLSNPITIEPETPVTEAAKILLDRKIDCLPVKDAKGSLIGILTSTDILKAFIKLSEILEDIQHIDIVMDSNQYDDVLALLEKWKVSVVSVGITANNDLNRTVFSFRVKDTDIGKLIKRLRKEGFSILPSD